ATGCRWAEGPVWFGDGRYLLWSDIPNNRIMRWDEETGVVSVFRRPSNNANGNTRDRQGRLVTCEHDARRVTRTEYDGAISVLCDRFDTTRLNSPNDVVVKSDDSVWFTDPPFGILTNYEGHKAPSELPTNVYRVGRDGRASVVTGDVPRPNGLAFSPDESRLYVVASGDSPRTIRVFDVVSNGTALANGRRGRPSAGPARRASLLLRAQLRLEQRPHFTGRRAPQRVVRRRVLGVDLRAEVVHGRVLLGLVVLGRHVERLAPNHRRLRGGGVAALDPAADLVPARVEEDDDRDRTEAVVEVAVGDVEVLVAQEDPQLRPRDRLDDPRDQRGVAVDVAAPVLGEHEHVL